MRKLQVYLTEPQYRYLRQIAEVAGSMTQAVRDLIDASIVPPNPGGDPFVAHVGTARPGSGVDYRAEDAKREAGSQPQ